MPAKCKNGMVRLSRYGSDRGKAWSGRKEPKTKRQTKPLSQEPQDIVRRAAVAAQSALVSGADGVAIDRELERAIRLLVVRGVYRRFVELSGFADETVRSLPKDTPWLRAFHAAIGSLELPVTAVHLCPELMSCALEPLATADDKRGRGAHFTPRALASDIVTKTLKPLLPLVAPEDTLELRICDPAVGGGVFLLELVSQLADRFVSCGRIADLYATRRLVAIHCAYGTDIDPVSVECTKLALRLECRAFALPATWLDGSIKCGDALVGLTQQQLSAGHWKLEAQPAAWLSPVIADAIELGTQARKKRMTELTTGAMST